MERNCLRFEHFYSKMVKNRRAEKSFFSSFMVDFALAREQARFCLVSEEAPRTVNTRGVSWCN
jgi:hypothetical protein